MARLQPACGCVGSTPSARPRSMAAAMSRDISSALSATPSIIARLAASINWLLLTVPAVAVRMAVPACIAAVADVPAGIVRGTEMFAPPTLRTTSTSASVLPALATSARTVTTALAAEARATDSQAAEASHAGEVERAHAGLLGARDYASMQEIFHPPLGFHNAAPILAANST